MTDIFERIQELKAKKAELEKEACQIQKDFEIYISNPDIPLGKRWHAFSRSPDELNDHSDYFISANSEGLQYILDNWFDAPEIYGRGKRIDCKNLFERVFSFNGENIDFDTKYNSAEKIELYKGAMEDILNQNIGSFCFDW